MQETLVLTDDGKKYAAEGSPEIHFFSAIPEEGSISKDDLEVMITMLLIISFIFHTSVCVLKIVIFVSFRVFYHSKIIFIT